MINAFLIDICSSRFSVNYSSHARFIVFRLCLIASLLFIVSPSVSQVFALSPQTEKLNTVTFSTHLFVMDSWRAAIYMYLYIYICCGQHPNYFLGLPRACKAVFSVVPGYNGIP